MPRFFQNFSICFFVFVTVPLYIWMLVVRFLFIGRIGIENLLGHDGSEQSTIVSYWMTSFRFGVF